jgi:ABC-type Fe3+/spermidine/putrescine transport system ATPase subunit
MGLKITNLNKNFGKFKAVDNLNLELKTGSFLSIVGPSGCGKTTTLRMISGFEIPDSGKIYINDNEVSEIQSKDRNIGIVFQNYALFPNMTVFDNISFGLVARKKSKEYINKKVKEMLDIIGLPDIYNRFPRQLSGGQQQRVALARALAIEPTMLLLDEPLSALDAKVRNSLRFEIKRIQSELGITTLYVPHDQEEALAISDEVIVMNKGKIHQMGKPEEIYNNPVDFFVADFIGISNIFSTKVIDRKNKIVAFGTEEFILDANLPLEDDFFVSVRPEDIKISKEPFVLNENCVAVKGTVIGQTFLGSVVRLKIQYLDYDMLVELEKDRKGQNLRNDEVFLSIPKQSLAIFKK